MNAVIAKLKGMAADRSGNFAIMTALMLPVLIGSAGIAVDLSAAMFRKTELQGAADAAALAASSELAAGDLRKRGGKRIAEEHLAGNLSQMGIEDYDVKVKVTRTPRALLSTTIDWKVDVTVSTVEAGSGLVRVLGLGDLDVAVNAVSTSVSGQRNAFSMYFVLDKSGSMLASTDQVKSRTTCPYYRLNASATVLYQSSSNPCYFTQMEALKNATNAMFAKFETADKDDKYFRFGAVSYADGIDKNASLAWGTSNAKNTINSLQAQGGTDSSDAFETAYEAVTKLSEVTTHTLKNGVLAPKKYIVFMTDGENNRNGADSSTLSYCTQAKAKGVIIYSVAFNAPAGGKTLLSKCASSPKTYFDAANAEELAKAFEDIAKDATGETPLLTH